jgi:hypothetical protein
VNPASGPAQVCRDLRDLRDQVSTRATSANASAPTFHWKELRPDRRRICRQSERANKGGWPRFRKASITSAMTEWCTLARFRLAIPLPHNIDLLSGAYAGMSRVEKLREQAAKARWLASNVFDRQTKML